MTIPAHALLKALLDVTRDIMRHNAHPQRPAIFPPADAILETAYARAQQQAAETPVIHAEAE